MKEVHVACAVEGSYVPHSAAMLHSVLANSEGARVHVHYLHGPDLPQSDRALLADMIETNGGEISFVEVADEMCADLPTRGFTGKATWYRIFLPELLPAIDRVLVLDADVIATDSLGPLWTTDVGDHYLAAVTNVFQLNHLGTPARLGLRDPHCYFNAGVMLMNLELMRKDRCTEALRDFGIRHGYELDWRDQDALNAVLGKKRLALHPRWNCMNSVLLFPWSAYVFDVETLAEARRDPAIRHFEGPTVNKPWHYLCDRGSRAVYIQHRRQTPWAHIELEGRTPANVVRRAARGLRWRAGQLRRRRTAALSA
jgi:lipopolysaccharide biosynthesis glycosyltransferase